MKITEQPPCVLLLNASRKFILMLNCTIFLTFILCLNATANGFSQDVKVTLDFHDVKLKKAFSLLEQKGNIRILYSEAYLPSGKTVSLKAKDMPVLQALELLIRDTPLEYQELNDGLIVIRNTRQNNSLNQVVTGTVTDSVGRPLSGVSVYLKGTSTGTTTNAEGKFTLDLPANGVLVFSSVGYTTQELSYSGQSTLAITMSESTEALTNVVVTALGIKKDRRSLTYSVTQVGGEDLTKAREINLGNALTGRVAGVNAVSTATGPSGSSRVVIRGNGSLNGDNQPLYVVNGIPINNSNQGAATTYGGIDRGDGLLSINPDDIESMSVLKGGTAAALYGSRAANGVILITTKSGRGQKGLGVELNSTYTLETPLDLLDWQYEYGAGSRGLAPTSQAEAIANGRTSWGAKLDGSSVFNPDGVERPYSAVKNNIQNFYQTGQTFTNTLSVTGGNENANFRFSASNLDNKGIVPSNSLNRKTFNLNVSGNLKKKLVFEANAQYNIEQTNNRIYTADFQKNPNAGAQIIATNLDVRHLAPGFGADGNETIWSDYIYATNPYFVINKIRNNDNRRRFIGSFTTRYNITDWLYARARVGIDYFNLKGTQLEPSGIAFNNRGSLSTDQLLSYESNAEGLLGFTKDFGKFSLNALAGGNMMKNTYDGVTLTSGQLNVPFVYFISNGSSQTFAQNYRQFAINSLFASADLGYNDLLFLTLTGRQDWFSTLSIAKNSLFYPSVGLGFMFTNAWNTRPSWLTYGKLRASWAQVGGGAPNPYGLDVNYTAQAQQHLGATLMNISSQTIPRPLTPYTSTTTELGLETRMFNGRLGLDLTLYDRTTTDDIVNASVPFSSGSQSVALNVGKIQNRGIEVLLTATPVKQEITWDISLNVAYNKNTVVKIADGLKSLFLPDATTRTLNGGIYHFEGMPYGMIAGNRARRDEKGQIVYNAATGIPLQGPLEALGRGVPPLTTGLFNTFNYKSLSLGFLLDGKFGAKVYSATNAFGTQFGLDKRTVEGGVRENGIVVSGVDVDGNPYSGNVTAQTYYQSIWSTLTDEFVTDADFIKLRQVTLGYTLPSAVLGKGFIQSVSLSLVARNLLLIYNTARNIDPESSYNNGNAQGLENFGLPTARSYGLNLMVKF